jgi:aerobic-type carbon monoxide dehydrogenase small subunit (CoxS/CutS family)
MSETIEVNGKIYAPSRSELEMKLIDYLREAIGLKGTKNGCGIGVCGACTVLVDGVPKRSCVLPVAAAAGKSVLTIEGLENSDGTLHPLQEAFIEAGAVQCGFCTPGMILTSYALLQKNGTPTREEVRRALKNNLCRCTGYQQIVDAVILAAEKMAAR